MIQENLSPIYLPVVPNLIALRMTCRSCSSYQAICGKRCGGKGWGEFLESSKAHFKTPLFFVDLLGMKKKRENLGHHLGQPRQVAHFSYQTAILHDAGTSGVETGEHGLEQGWPTRTCCDIYMSSLMRKESYVVLGDLYVGSLFIQV